MMDFRYDNRLTYDLKEACKDYGFLVPPEFWDEANHSLLDLWNGVGAEGDWLNPFIPETVYGLNISLASLPHDWAFKFHRTKQKFHIANLYFLYNMNQIVRDESSNAFMTNIRFLRTNKYYMACESDSGLEAYSVGKDIIY